jgi:Lipoprotein LpqB beta-propeller domain
VARPRAAVRLLAGTALAAVAAAGCAAVPSSGAPRTAPGAASQVQQFVQPIPPRPQPGWTPDQVVQGFLAASASFAGNHAAARRFLAPATRRTFRPSWAVTVVSGQPLISTNPFGPANQGDSDVLATVTLSGQQVASISDIGQYFDNPGSHDYVFQLEKAKGSGEWLITRLPRNAPLLLTQDNFDQVYQPRNLYFWASQGPSLVPEPVFAPQEDTYADVATNLVKALLRTGPADGQELSWLAAATLTSFPPGTTLIGKVGFSGSAAVVNLGGSAARAPAGRLRSMADQLVTTLTSTSYGEAPIAKSVDLEVNGQLRDTAQAGSYIEQLPGSGSSAPLYYLAGGGQQAGSVSTWTGTAGQAIRNLSGRAQIAFSQVAISAGVPLPGEPAGDTTVALPDEQLAGTVPSGRGCGVWYGPLAGTAPLALRVLPDADSGPCTSVTWDSAGNIWAVTAAGIWVLPAGSRAPAAVSLPPLPGGSAAPYHVLAVRIAPDAVRVAMLVQTGSGASAATQVVMAAVTEADGEFALGPTVSLAPGLAGEPAALSWLDPDHLVVLARSELYDVPVNGEAAVPLVSAPPGMDDVSAAGPGQIAVAGGGEVLTSSGPDQALQFAVKGASPAYPQ